VTTPSTASVTQRDLQTDGKRDFRLARDRDDEVKPSWKTTELFVYVTAVMGVLIASLAVGDRNDNGGDYFAADTAWWYITLLTIGYMIARGLAKSGSHSRSVR
jgi:hypothetical protein